MRDNLRSFECLLHSNSYSCGVLRALVNFYNLRKVKIDISPLNFLVMLESDAFIDLHGFKRIDAVYPHGWKLDELAMIESFVAACPQRCSLHDKSPVRPIVHIRSYKYAENWRISLFDS